MEKDKVKSTADLEAIDIVGKIVDEFKDLYVVKNCLWYQKENDDQNYQHEAQRQGLSHFDNEIQKRYHRVHFFLCDLVNVKPSWDHAKNGPQLLKIVRENQDLFSEGGKKKFFENWFDKNKRSLPLSLTKHGWEKIWNGIAE